MYAASWESRWQLPRRQSRPLGAVHSTEAQRPACRKRDSRFRNTSHDHSRDHFESLHRSPQRAIRSHHLIERKELIRRADQQIHLVVLLVHKRERIELL